MAEISAATVMNLRKISGQGMMDCKKALDEAGGNIEKALEILRKKGLATLAKRAERETSQGVIVGKISPDGRTAALASLCCETDFVAKSDDFVHAAGKLAEYAMACRQDQGPENIVETEVNGVKFQKVITDLVSKTGEKTEVGDYIRYNLSGPGLVTIYIHFNKKVATMVQFETSSQEVADSAVFKQAASDIAMHITAINPLALDEKGISPEIIAQERAIYAEQVKNKPAQMVEKIVDGKIKKFFSEKCLLSQPFVKDDSKTVEQVIKESAKAADGDAKISRFVRIGLG